MRALLPLRKLHQLSESEVRILRQNQRRRRALHPFRNDPNSEIRWQTFDLVNTAFTTNPDGSPCGALSKYVGRGDMDPLLNAVL